VLENSKLGQKDFNPRRKALENSTLEQKDFSPKGNDAGSVTREGLRGGFAAPF
jgi:hypothetical protein